MFVGKLPVTIVSIFVKDFPGPAPRQAILRRLYCVRLCFTRANAQISSVPNESQRNTMADNNTDEPPAPKTVAEATTGTTTDAVETPRKVNENLETEYGTTTIDNAVV